MLLFLTKVRFILKNTLDFILQNKGMKEKQIKALNQALSFNIFLVVTLKKRVNDKPGYLVSVQFNRLENFAKTEELCVFKF